MLYINHTLSYSRALFQLPLSIYKLSYNLFRIALSQDYRMYILCVADVIIDMGKVCIKNDVNKVFISSIVCSKNFMKQKLINELNDVLKERCVVYGFVFINNSNIKKEHLWKDVTHLVEEGKVILAKKIIKSLNNFLCQLLQTPVNR